MDRQIDTRTFFSVGCVIKTHARLSVNLHGFPEHVDCPRSSSLRGAEGSPESSTRCGHFIAKFHLLLQSSTDCHWTTGQRKCSIIMTSTWILFDPIWSCIIIWILPHHDCLDYNHPPSRQSHGYQWGIHSPPGWHLSGWSIRHHPNSRGPRYWKERHEVSHWWNVMLLHVVHMFLDFIALVKVNRRHSHRALNQDHWDGGSTLWGHQEYHSWRARMVTMCSYAPNLPRDLSTKKWLIVVTCSNHHRLGLPNKWHISHNVVNPMP